MTLCDTPARSVFECGGGVTAPATLFRSSISPLTDTMPPRFLVPALISGMILTVRTVSPALVCSLFICFVRVLVIHFGPSTRHEHSRSLL
jgi:hypothetical protein